MKNIKMKKIPKYNYKSIERNWQKKWQEEKIFQPDLEKAKKPFYNLMMFPYPSAEGLHVGSAYTFSGVDTFGRFKKMQGFDVFEPIGLDGFGIHSENYAMKIGQHIRDVSKRTEKTYYRQLRQIGNMHDWSRTVETYKPNYYKWTQWLFLQMYKVGLAHQKQANVNWCPSCKTVLSDEQVISGKCERCEAEVENKELKQWFFSITKYADKLLKNLEWIDWPDDVKLNQRNWIGKSQGAKIFFDLKGLEYQIEVFTTRPDTLFGATYMVVAPEHELFKKYNSKIKNRKQIQAYINKSLGKSEQDRKSVEKIKSGVQIKGIKAINPATSEEIPIWVADYVLAGYGTGAIMAVPAHDERDFEFAQKYNLPIKQVVAQYVYENGEDKPRKDKKQVKRNVITAIVKHWEKDEYLLLDWTGHDWNCFIMGGIKPGEDDIRAAAREITEETGFKNQKFIQRIGGEIHVEFFAKHKGVNRYAKNQGVYFELKNGQRLKRSKNEKAKHDFVWVKKKDMEKMLNVEGHNVLWKRLQQNDFCFTGEGVSINSGIIEGMKTKEAKKEVIKWLVKNKMGKKAVDYKLRDWCISRQRYWGPPIPIIWCRRCAVKQQKPKVLLVHGFEGHKNSNWFPAFRKELQAAGFEVLSPSMSTSKNPTVKSWVKELTPYINKLSDSDVIVCHSLGSMAVMHTLNENNKKVGKVFLVASALGTQNRNWDWFRKEWPSSDVDSLEKFWKKKVDWKDAEKKIGQVHIILSKDDPYISVRHYKDIKIEGSVLQKWSGHKHFQQKNNQKLQKYIIKNVLEGVEPVAIPVPEKDLPVKLPPMEDFLPEGKGKGPLAKNKNFVHTKCPVCDGEAERETDVSDPFVDSSWYFFRYPSTEYENKPFDKKITKKWLPVDSYIGGKEHTVLHLLYSRFVTMVLNDLRYIDFDEPYKRFFGHGLITKDGAKMSKSKGNVVNPDEMIEKFGADTMRLYFRFLGDFSQGGDWRDSGIEGMHKFVKRMWTIFHELDGTGKGVKSTSMIDKTIKIIGEDLEKLSFNTAVARLMEYVNWLKENKEGFDLAQARKAKETLALVLSPMAPHIAESFWQTLGNKKSIFLDQWPSFDEKNTIEEQIEMVIQVNGKLRDRLVVQKDISEQEITALALESDKVGKFVGDSKIRKVVHVPGRLVNIVV